MRFATAVLPLALFATSVVGQLATIRNVLLDIQADVEVYGDAFAAGDGAAIIADGDEVLASINAGIPVVQAATAVGLIDALSLRTTIQAVVASVDDTVNTAIAQKPAVVALGLQTQVHDAFVAQRAAVAVLGAAIVAKVPAIVQATAQGYVTQIDTSLARAIAAYA